MEDSTLLSIKEFADFTGVNQSTLRYYDEIGLLPPAARGNENNYRYYTPLQLTIVKFINVLVDLGIPLVNINEMVKDRTPESMIELLSQQEIILDRRLYELRSAYSIIHTFRRNIQNGLMGQAGEVRIETLDEINYVLGPVNEFGDGRNYYDTFKQFGKAANDYRINLDYPVGGYHYAMESFLEEPDKPDKYFSMDPIGNCTRQAGRYLVGYRQGYHGADGYYGGFSDVPQKMKAYAEERELIFSGPVYVVYLLNEISTKEPEQYLSRIAVKVLKKKERSRLNKLKSHENAKNCPVKSLCVKPHCVD